MLALLLPALAGCGDSDSQQPIEQTKKVKSELDVIGLAARSASLVVLSSTTDAAGRLRFERAITRMGGTVLATLPPRLIVAQLPDRADALLTQLGVVARFDRAVLPGEIPNESLSESRFTAVYSNRWHPAQVAGPARITARRSVRKTNEPFEGPPRPFERPARLAADDPDDSVSVPYASGTIVVSVVLPESNGSIDASTEDWNEEHIREAYLKVQAALDRVAESDPNANLRFVMHFESAPAAGGLAGTVDTDYEYGQRSQYGDWENEAMATADVLSAILGHPVNPDQGAAQAAAQEYQLSLRRRYSADAAFFVIVAANQNSTAGIRARARLNGPWTTLDSLTESSTFMHEFGHIFGALDEYCADFCNDPTGTHGYLGIYNANSQYREGSHGGINNGKGESAPSLMDSNQMDAVNGYTRGAWGWLDRDGDGIIEVRDTLPLSQLEASVDGQVVRLTGQVVDRPEARVSGGYSVNHLTSLKVEIERAGTILDTIDVALPGDVRGRQPVNLALPPLPQGQYVLRVRAKNEVGNEEPRPVVLQATVTATGNTPPIPHLTLPDVKAVSSSRAWSIRASAVDLDGNVPEVRIDLGADGTFETPWGPARNLDVTPPPGVYPIVVQARDPSGATASTRGELLVFEGNAPPTVRLDPVPSLIHGIPRAALTLTAAASDPEGGPVDYSWIAELATGDGSFRRETGWGAGNQFTIELPTPERLASRSLHLAAGDNELGQQINDLVAVGPRTVAVAGGWRGVWFLDVTNPAAPTVLSRLALETSAKRMWRDQNRLYVLGNSLTVVNISDIRRPAEIRQVAANDDVETATRSEEMQIGEGGSGASHYFFPDGDRTRRAEVRVTTDHPQPADLRVVLYPPSSSGLAPITLRDKVAAPAGVNTWIFTEANTPALAALRTLPATDDWMIEVVDDVENGLVGSLQSSQLDLQTRCFAAKLLPNANEIVGKLGSSDLVVTGRGVQVLSVSQPAAIRQRSRVESHPAVGATLVGSSVVVATGLTDKGKAALDPEAAVLKGIYAVDLSVPTTPRVVRELTTAGDPSNLARVGSRVYVRVNPTCEVGTPGCEDPKPSTLVIKASTFANGGATWKLGESPLFVDSRAFGDDQALWTAGSDSYVQRYDVSVPANLRVALAYPQNRAHLLLPIGPLADGSDLVLFDGSVFGTLVDRDRSTNVLSRVYHLTVEARDAAGAVTRQTRTVHINPYDHAPTITRVDRTEGSHPGEWHVFEIFGSDPDATKIWNPHLFFRVDWDGDGVFDTDWNWMPITGDQPARISKLYEQAGTYQAMFEVRDGYYASHRFPHTIVVQ